MPRGVRASVAWQVQRCSLSNPHLPRSILPAAASAGACARRTARHPVQWNTCGQCRHGVGQCSAALCACTATLRRAARGSTGTPCPRRAHVCWHGATPHTPRPRRSRHVCTLQPVCATPRPPAAAPSLPLTPAGAACRRCGHVLFLVCGGVCDASPCAAQRLLVADRAAPSFWQCSWAPFGKTRASVWPLRLRAPPRARAPAPPRPPVTAQTQNGG